jgi:hypothetical protein
MKTLSQILILSLVVMLSQCAKDADPCEGKICLNGGHCVDGTCQCMAHYEGGLCEDQSTPSKIIVTKVTVTKFPATDLNGAGWDVSSGPDIVPTINGEYIGDTAFTDATQNQYDFTPITQLELLPLTQYQIHLVDYDSPDPDDDMGGYTFKPYKDTNGFPATLELSSTSSQVAFTLSVTYVF